jgi:hypothetical protein
MEEVKRCSGMHFSPRVADAFVTLPAHLFEEIRTSPEGRSSPYTRGAPFLRRRAPVSAAGGARAVVAG